MIESSQEDVTTRSIGDIDSDEFGIEPENLGMAYEAFMQYSDPIGSIMREITSNAWDATIEAGNNEPVVVTASEKHPPDDERWVAFKDNGTGLVPLPKHTPDGRKAKTMLEEGKISESKYKGIINTIEEKIKEANVPSMLVYKMFFSSTKRQSLDQLGFFGLGAKSPLGYADMFEVITYREGFKYHYIVRKGEDKPQLDLFTWEETDAENGTTVRVPIKSSRDWQKFKDACTTQLAYFDNVVFEGGFDNKVDNDFEVYRGDHFIFRPDSKFDKLHICLGKVYYPMDFDVMDIKEGYHRSYGSSTRSGWHIPIGLYFPLDEQKEMPLKVVWNRESIEYNQKTIDSIEDKLELAKQELRGLYNDQFDDLSSVREWYEQYFLAEDKEIELDDGISIPLTDEVVEDTTVDIPEYSNIFDKTPGNPFYMLKFHRRVDRKGYISQDADSVDISNLFQNPDNYPDIYITDKSFSTKKNKWIAKHLDDRQGKFILLKTPDLVSDLDGEDRDILEARYNSYFSNDDSDPTDIELKAMLKFEREARKYFLEKFNDYDEITVSESYNPRQDTDSSNENKYADYDPDKKFPLRTASLKSGHSDEYGWSRVRWKYEVLENLDQQGTLVIYGFQKDADNLEKIMELLDRIGSKYKRGYGDSFHRKRLRVVKIAMSREEMFSDLRNSYHIDEFLESDHHILRKMVNAFAIRGNLPSSRKVRKWKKHVPEAYKLYNRLSNLKNTYSFSVDSYGDDWINEFIQERDHLLIPEYGKKVEKLKGYILKYPILSWLERGSPNLNGLGDKLDIESEIEEYIEDRPPIDPHLLYRYKSHKNQQDNNG